MTDRAPPSPASNGLDPHPPFDAGLRQRINKEPFSDMALRRKALGLPPEPAEKDASIPAAAPAPVFEELAAQRQSEMPPVRLGEPEAVEEDEALARSAKEIKEACDELAAFLIEKNRAYGDSALNPVRIMSRASSIEQILVRIDDKLSRLARGELAGEDVEQDLRGYFTLLGIARKRAQAKAHDDGAKEPLPFHR